MRGWKKGNVWKAVGFLLGLGGFMMAMILVPAARPDPTLEGPQLELPSMTHVPPASDVIRVR